VAFSRNIIADILQHEALKGAELRLVDSDADRLNTAEGMALLIRKQLGA
jgi:alpha-galactosidase/6-phospho-beta-glucosidase family protein